MVPWVYLVDSFLIAATRINTFILLSDIYSLPTTRRICPFHISSYAGLPCKIIVWQNWGNSALLSLYRTCMPSPYYRADAVSYTVTLLSLFSPVVLCSKGNRLLDQRHLGFKCQLCSLLSVCYWQFIFPLWAQFSPPWNGINNLFLDH